MFTDEKYTRYIRRGWKIYWNCRRMFSPIFSDAPFSSSRVGKTHDPAAWKVSPFHSVLPGVCWWVLLGERKKTSYLSSPNKSLLKNIIVITICLCFRKCFNVFFCAFSPSPSHGACTVLPVQIIHLKFRTPPQTNTHNIWLKRSHSHSSSNNTKTLCKRGWICSIFFSLVGARKWK